MDPIMDPIMNPIMDPIMDTIMDTITKMKVVNTSGQCFGSIFRLDMKEDHLENSKISLFQFHSFF